MLTLSDRYADAASGPARDRTNGASNGAGMIRSFLRGHTWEPAPILEQESADGATTVTDLRGPGEADQAPPPDVEQAGERAREHLARYLDALHANSANGSDTRTPETLYFVDGAPEALREVVGFRMRGHPRALMGAFILPRHHRSPVANGRPSLASFLSKPPRSVGYAVEPTAPGHITIFLPGLSESIPAFMERLREEGGSGIHVDASVIDIAFDLRLSNPSEIRSHSHAVAKPARSVFRTIGGHVISGVSVGLQQTLHKDDRFIALASAVQHRPSGDVPLPTLAVNRSILALQSPLSEGESHDAVRSTLAFHPDTASDEHILGACYEDIG